MPLPLRLISLLALVLAAGMMAACGPARGGESGNSVDETLRIAQEFRQDGDLNRARVQLESLDVANVLHWLIYVAEERISAASGAEETQAVVQLTLAMGGSSGAIRAYAIQNGLLAEPTQPPQPAAQAALQLAATTQPEPAVPQAQILVPTATPVAQAQSSAPAEATPEAAVPTVEATLTLTETPTEASITKPQARASTSLNVRGGPGTEYPVVGALNGGTQADILAKNPSGDWWQVAMPDGQQGWVYGPLVEPAGDTTTVAVAANIPEPPPVPPTATPAPTVPVEPTATPVPAGPEFRMVEKRLWDVYENGGSLSGPTVTCGEKRQLVVNVIDANGARLNGVAVQVLYGAQEIYVTGSQGKGDGVAEFVLGRGQDVKVIRDTDGREVTSDVATALSTEPANIPYETLIGGRFCTDDASCKSFVDAPGCWGHYSWTVTFQRNY